jgi:hypothetical protein
VLAVDPASAAVAACTIESPWDVAKAFASRLPSPGLVCQLQSLEKTSAESLICASLVVNHAKVAYGHQLGFGYCLGDVCENL